MKSSWTGSGFSQHSVPSLSKTTTPGPGRAPLALIARRGLGGVADMDLVDVPVEWERRTVVVVE